MMFEDVCLHVVKSCDQLASDHMKSSKEGWDHSRTHKRVQRMQHFVLQGQYMH